MRVVILRGRVNIGHFVRGSVNIRDVVRITCIFSFLLFLDTLFLCFRSCDHFFYLHCIIFFIYVDVCFFFRLPLTCVVSFLSLYTYFLLHVCNLLFLLHTKIPWWVLFKVFQKYRLSKSTCYKLSCKIFQEFVLW